MRPCSGLLIIRVVFVCTEETPYSANAYFLLDGVSQDAANRPRGTALPFELLNQKEFLEAYTLVSGKEFRQQRISNQQVERASSSYVEPPQCFWEAHVNSLAGTERSENQ